MTFLSIVRQTNKKLVGLTVNEQTIGYDSGDELEDSPPNGVPVDAKSASNDSSASDPVVG
jgi:hypothetical protein